MAGFDKQDTYNKVIDIIASKLKIEKETINPQSGLQDLGADSLDMVEIIMKLEEVVKVALCVFKRCRMPDIVVRFCVE